MSASTGLNIVVQPCLSSTSSGSDNSSAIISCSESQLTDPSSAAESSTVTSTPTCPNRSPYTPSSVDKDVDPNARASSKPGESAARCSSIILNQHERDRKMLGYEAYSRFLSDEQTFFMVRRFRTLNVRAALALQDEIVELEADLNDREHYNKNYFQEYYDNGSIRLDKDVERRELIKDKIVPRLTVYNEFINSYAQLASRPAAENRERDEIRKWLAAHPYAIHDPEKQYIEDPSLHEDLISVLPLEKSLFRRMLEWTFVRRLPVFRRKNEEGKRVLNSDHGRLENFSSIVIAIFGLGMLIGPLWILDVITNTRQQLGIITCFIAIFFFVVAVATNAKIFESLAAAAAYSAVLMVFLQLGAKETSSK